MPESTLLGAAAALGSATAWVMGAFLFKAIGDLLSPLAMTLAKGALSVLLLGLVWLLVDAQPVDERSMMLLIASGVLGIAIGDTLFFQALKDLSAFSLIVLLVVGQAMTVGLAIVFLGESLTIGQTIGVPLILAGVVLVLTKSSEEGPASPTKMRGIVFGLAASACMAGSMVIAKEALTKSDPIPATFVRMLAGTVGVLGFGFATGSVKGWLTPFYDRRLLAKFVAAVAVIAFGGFWLSMVAMKHAPVVVASTLTSTEPVIALGVSVLVLKQRAQLRHLVASLLTVAGVVLMVPEVYQYLKESLF